MTQMGMSEKPKSQVFTYNSQGEKHLLDFSTMFLFLFYCWVNFCWISHYLMQRCVGHTAWAPERHEGHSQAGPKGRQLEVGAQRAPRLLVIHIGSWTTWQMAQQAWWIVFFNSGSYCSNICSSKQNLSWSKLTTRACKHVVNGPPTYKQLTI